MSNLKGLLLHPWRTGSDIEFLDLSQFRDFNEVLLCDSSKLKYFRGVQTTGGLISILDKCPPLEYLCIEVDDYYPNDDPDEESKLVSLMGKLRHGLKELRIFSFPQIIDVSFIFASPAMRTLEYIDVSGDYSSSPLHSLPLN